MKIIKGSYSYLTLMIIWIIVYHCSTYTDAKGFRMRAGGGINPARSNVMMPRTGLFPRTGMMPFFIPVVIPIGMSRSRNYNQQYGGLQCYACEGTDNDICVINPASTTAGVRRLTCPSNQYCSVVRKEIYLKTAIIENVNASRPVERIGNLSSAVNNNVTTRTLSSSGFTEMNDHGSTTADKTKISTTTQTSQLPFGNEKGHHVFISRGCRSPEYIQQQHALTNSDKALNSERITKTYTQFCVADYCNFGDGRLKCYECEGEGNNHPCMVNPESFASVITCQPNYYCNIIWSINNTISVNNNTRNNTSNAKVTISRGCKAAATPINEEDDDDDDNINSPLAMACSSDLCNSVDGNQMALLYVRSKATGFSLEFNRISMLSLFVYLMQKN